MNKPTYNNNYQLYSDQFRDYTLFQIAYDNNKLTEFNDRVKDVLIDRTKDYKLIPGTNVSIYFPTNEDKLKKYFKLEKSATTEKVYRVYDDYLYNSLQQVLKYNKS